MSDDPRKTDPIKPEWVADLERKGEEESSSLPPFLQQQVRQREAYLTLLQDLTDHLAQDWSVNPEALAKARVNEAIARSLKMWI